MSAVLADRIAQEHAAAADALSPAVVSLARRQQAVAALAAHGFPTTRDENWKYANLRTLERVRLAPSASGARTVVSIAELPALIEGYARYTFVDGVFVAELSRPTNVTGVSVRSLRNQEADIAAGDAEASEFVSGSAAEGRIFGAAGERTGAPAPGDAVAPNSPASGAEVRNLNAGGNSPGTPAAREAPARSPATTSAATPDARAMAAARDPSTPPSSPDSRFALLNDAFATDGAAIDIASGVDCPGCIELIFIATEPAQSAASYPRIELNVAPNAKLGIIERHISLRDDSNFVNGAVRVTVGQAAHVTHYRLQQAGARATWFDTLSATVERDARYEVHAVNLGAVSARTTFHVQLAGDRAELALYVVSLADQQQVHDAFALVEHIGAHTKSEQMVRGIAGGRARVAFNSKVVVRKQAHHADSSQSLRGLLAGSQAEIDVRPQLEIYTDEVRCNHGATAGKLDDNMLFYLLSRGIDRDTAQQLLKWAFLEDVVSRITRPELRKQIEASLAGQMQETAALKELI